MATTTKQTPVQFFYEQAGWCVEAGESEEAGRMRCARALANAEREGSDAGLSFEWSEDDQTDASFRDTDEPYALWVCLCRDGAGTKVASCGGIDFGAGNDPWSSPYRRVMEAELALEAMA